MNTETTAAISKAVGKGGQVRPLRAFMKRTLKPYPALFVPVFRRFGPDFAKELLISPETEFVIEGFPRSANTFSVVAFQAAGNRSVRVAHHLHAEAQIIAGTRRGLPVMVLLRDPEKAIRSLSVFYPGIDENAALREWIAFYRRLLPLKDSIFVAEFSKVTKDFGAVTASLNEKFDTDFKCFEHTDSNVAAVYREIEDIARRRRGGAEMQIARPSEFKRKAQSEIRYDFDQNLLAQARSLFVEWAGSDEPLEHEGTAV
jgi:hypothetical protein